jgi:hypothetical protein
MELWNLISESYKYNFDRYTIFMFSQLQQQTLTG